MQAPARAPSSAARGPLWVAVATAVHAAGLVALLLLPMRRGALAAAPAIDATELAISLENESAAPVSHGTAEALPATAETTRSPSESAPAIVARASGPSSASGAASSEPMSASVGGEVPPGGTPGPATSGGVSAIPFTARELGIGPGNNPFLPRAEEKVPTTGPDTPIARSLRGSGLAHDRELGLGPEGPAISALQDATTASIAPLRGRAHFIVRTGGDGLVLGIDLVDSEGGSGWTDAGRIALENLRGKKFKVPSGARAMNMHIEIKSEMKLPNGQNAPVGGRLGDNDMPELTIPDVSNIGAKPRRVIHARAVGTEVL
ncbi:MAG TPA: hypothetical protein VLT33_36145 [Labilithrix sp.]|nr:hypothetical protein [Labilithrix sp.]